ncbi:MAG: transposase [Cyanobacteria bacterium]|nr:transposase [Cyanobacteriota bacterium]
MIPESKRVYVDETGFEAPLVREYADAKSGRILGERTGKRFARTRLITGLKEGKSIAPKDLKGYCNTDAVLTWVHKILIPLLKQGDVVICDNVIFCKSQKSNQLLRPSKRLGWGYYFYPPLYSPELNPIEHFWAILKAWIRGLNQPLLHISKILAQVFGNLNA